MSDSEDDDDSSSGGDDSDDSNSESGSEESGSDSEDDDSNGSEEGSDDEDSDKAIQRRSVVVGPPGHTAAELYLRRDGYTPQRSQQSLSMMQQHLYTDPRQQQQYEQQQLTSPFFDQRNVAMKTFASSPSSPYNQSMVPYQQTRTGGVEDLYRFTERPNSLQPIQPPSPLRPTSASAPRFTSNPGYRQFAPSPTDRSVHIHPQTPQRHVASFQSTRAPITPTRSPYHSQLISPSLQYRRNMDHDELSDDEDRSRVRIPRGYQDLGFLR